MPVAPPQSGGSGSDLLEALRESGSPQYVPHGAVLFRKGETAAGIFLIESGEVRVLWGSWHTHKQLLKVAGAGSVLGLSESIAKGQHPATAVAGSETRVLFVPREEFLVFLESNEQLRSRVMECLSQELHELYQKFATISAHPGRPRQRLIEMD